MALLVYLDGTMHKVDDAQLSSPALERKGKASLITIGEISPFIQGQLQERGMIEIGVYNPDEPAPSINDLLNAGLQEPERVQFSWVDALRDHLQGSVR